MVSDLDNLRILIRKLQVSKYPSEHCLQRVPQCFFDDIFRCKKKALKNTRILTFISGDVTKSGNPNQSRSSFYKNPFFSFCSRKNCFSERKINNNQCLIRGKKRKIVHVFSLEFCIPTTHHHLTDTDPKFRTQKFSKMMNYDLFFLFLF